MTRTLCIHIPNWPIQRRRWLQPELTARPILLHASIRGARRVAGMSRQAARWGVWIGMPWAEATSLADVDEVSQLVVEEHDPSTDRATLEDLADWCRQFSPIVGLDDRPEPDALLLDVSRLGWISQKAVDRAKAMIPPTVLSPREWMLARRAVRRFARRGLTVRVAVADTLAAAWGLAHFPPPPDTSPDGLHLQIARSGAALMITAPGRSLDVLLDRPIEALRLENETSSLLRSLGVETVGAFASLPTDEIATRLGPCPLKRLEQAAGTRPEPIAALPLRPVFALDESLEYPLARREAVESLVDAMTRRIADLVREHGRRLLSLHWRLTCERRSRFVDEEEHDASQDGPAWETAAFTVGVYRPTASFERLAPLVRARLERLRLPGPLWSIRVEAPLTVAARATQRRLFDEDDAQGGLPHALIERLAGRLGDDAVLEVRPRREALPEAAVRRAPLVGPKALRRRSTSKAATDAIPPRPTRLLPSPAPLARFALTRSGRPGEFIWNDRAYRIAKSWGPERIETGWHRGPYQRRDYYRVETDHGRRFWIFRRLQDGQWFLHGFF